MGRGDLWVVAVLLGFADRSAIATLVAAAAGVFALDRFGSAGLADIAGTQSVLGEAGWHGTGATVAAAWLVGLALVVVCRSPGAAAVAGALGGLLIAGPAFNGGVSDALVRLAAITAGGGLAWLLAPRSASARQPRLALVLSGIAVLLIFGGSV